MPTFIQPTEPTNIHNHVNLHLKNLTNIFHVTDILIQKIQEQTKVKGRDQMSAKCNHF